MNSHSWTLCRELFKELNILPLQLQYILSLSVFVVKNIDDFTIISDIHSINTCHKSILHPPLLRLTEYQKGVYYAGIKIYKCLPLKIKKLSGNINHFKKEFKKFLLQASFYTVDEFLDWTSINDLYTLYFSS